MLKQFLYHLQSASGTVTESTTSERAPLSSKVKREYKWEYSPDGNQNTSEKIET